MFTKADLLARSLKRTAMLSGFAVDSGAWASQETRNDQLERSLRRLARLATEALIEASLGA